MSGDAESNSLFFFSECDDDDLFGGDGELKKASKREKLELLEFIGGFERWEEIPNDCKKRVIEFLDYWTRCHLSLCSKENRRLVRDSVLFTSPDARPDSGGLRLKPSNLAVLCKSDFEQKQIAQAVIEKIVLANDSIKVFTASGFVRSWKFTQRGDECTVISKSHLKPSISYSNIYTVSKAKLEEEHAKIAIKMLKKARNDLTTLEISMNWNIEKNGLPSELPRVRDLVLPADYREAMLWLGRLDPECALEQLTVQRNCESFRDPPVSIEPFICGPVRRAKTLRFRPRIHMEDVYFLSLEATRMIIPTDSLSYVALMEFIRKWSDDELDPEFCQCVILTRHNYRREMNSVPQNFEAIEHQFTFWNSPHSRFFKKFGIYDNSGDFYQVSKRNDPFSSISVFVAAQCVAIIRTGFACVEERTSALDGTAMNASQEMMKEPPPQLDDVQNIKMVEQDALPPTVETKTKSKTKSKLLTVLSKKKQKTPVQQQQQSPKKTDSKEPASKEEKKKTPEKVKSMTATAEEEKAESGKKTRTKTTDDKTKSVPKKKGRQEEFMESQGEDDTLKCVKSIA
ncbi:unnamed protein product [Caenorhabditis sp. 36 PRJEB53466]|nr:unnamed protein product [Caenorhabditis sp. 36 PRJEB53466]